MKKTMSTPLGFSAIMTCIIIWSHVTVRAVAFRCGGLYNLEEDMDIILHSPGYPGMYPKMTQCQWTIVSSNNKKLEMEFLDFSVEGQSPCKYDKLMVDGNNCDFMTPTILCGDTTPTTIESAGTILCLRFLSDIVVNLRGFKVKVSLSDNSLFVPAPNVEIFFDQQKSTLQNNCQMFPLVITNNATITSPNFGQGRQYPANTVCRWLIYLDKFHFQKVIFRFTTIDIENHYACELDNVQILKGEETKPDFNLQFCGSTLPEPVVLMESTLIMFSSDGMVEMLGFSASLDFVLINVTVHDATEQDHQHYWNSNPSAVSMSATTNSLISTSPLCADSIFSSQIAASKTHDKSATNAPSSSSPSSSPSSSSSAATSILSTLGELNLLTMDSGDEEDLKTSGTTRSLETVSPLVSPSFSQITSTAPSSSNLHSDGQLMIVDICNQTYYKLTARSVVFQSPGFEDGVYPVYKRCDVVVAAPDQRTRLRGTFMHMDIEGSSDCGLDWLDLSSKSGSIGKFCGNTATNFQTADSMFMMTFVSDSIIARSGFQLQVQVIEGNIRSTSDPQHAITEITMCDSIFEIVGREAIIVMSPGYSRGLYPLDTSCDLKLFASAKFVTLEVTVVDMDIEQNRACTYDYLAMYDGITPSSSTITRICGAQTGMVIKTTGPNLRISFYSDLFVAKRGFKLTIRPQNDDIRSVEASRISSSSSPSSSSLTTASMDMTSTQQILSTVNVVSPSVVYNGGLKTSIVVSNSAFVSTSITTTTIRDALLLNSQTPTMAASKISANATIATSIDGTVLSLSGNKSATTTSTETLPVPLNFSTHSSPLTVSIITPDKLTQPGLTLTTLQASETSQQVTTETDTTSSPPSPPPTLDTACLGLSSTLREKSGVVTSPGFLYRQPYPNDITCTWVVEGGKSKNITVQFLNFNLELHPKCSRDFVEIYNVSGSSLKLIGRYCGSLLPTNITSSGEALIIKFQSDGEDNSEGFLLTYDVYDVGTNESKCSDGRTRCRDNILCIPTEWLCDGETDCPSGGDEEQCDVCSDREFACSDHSCLPLYQVCDGITNCNHGDDEYDCVKINESKILLFRKEGLWLPVCADGDWPSSAAHLQWVCTAAGQGDFLSTKDVTVFSPFYILLSVYDDNMTTTDNGEHVPAEPVRKIVSPVCLGNKVISLQCASRECGVQNVHLPQPYILGSSSSVDDQWPWTVALFSGSFFLCGASLVSRQWLVTAGHCIYNLVNSPQTTTARIGHVNIQSPDIIIKRVSEIIIHPQNNYISENDIGLIRLESPVNVGPNQRPLCVDAIPREWSPNTPCYVAGWGVIDKTRVTNTQGTTILHHAKVNIWERTQCELSYPGKIKQSMLCAGYHDGEMDACKGDSGGPLMCSSHFKKWHLVGVISWGEGCGQIGKPGVYTKVDSYLDWISLTINEEVSYGASCDFEHPNVCGYSSQSGSEFMWTRRAGGVTNIPKPYLDNTFKNESGHFMYAYAPYGLKYMTTVLATPILSMSDTGYCMLASAIFQDCSECNFEVQAIDCSVNQTQTLFKIVNSAASTNWMRFKVDLPPNVCQIYFLSTSGRQSEGGIGLDDVSLTLGLCEGSKLLNCNFSSFGIDAFCGYRQDDSDDFNWVISQCSTDVNKSKQVDSFLRAEHINGYPGDKARIISPTLKTTISMCFSFNFRVSSANAGILNVCQKVYYNGDTSIDCSLWSSKFLQNLQPNVWTNVKMKLPAFSLESSIVLQMSLRFDQGYVDVNSLLNHDGDCL